MGMAALAALAASATTAPVALAASADESIATGSEVKRIRTCCRGCGKMECGVWATVVDGKVVKIEGDESSHQSRGSSCSKSQASMQALYHPARLMYPLKRTNPKGDDDPGWQRISWDEAYETIGSKFNELIDRYGGNSCFGMNGTGRVWPSNANWYARIFGSVNQHKAAEICRGPRMFVGDMTVGRQHHNMANVESHPHRVYLQWGTACEYSNYDDSARVVTDVANNAVAHIVVDPRMPPLGKGADYWLNIRPGTDGAIALCWTNIVMKNKLYEELFVKRWTNGPFLYVEDMEPSGGWILDAKGGLQMKTRLLKESDLVEGGSYKRFMVWDNISNGLIYFDAETTQWQDEEHTPPTTGLQMGKFFHPDPSEFNPKRDPALNGTFEVTLKDGRTVTARPVWDMYEEYCSQFTPEHAEEITGVDAKLIEEACLVWATRPEGQPFGNGGIHYNLATDTTGNNVQTIRAMTILGAITGNFDTPAGNRGSFGAELDRATCQYGMYKKSSQFGVEGATTNFEKTENMIGVEEFPMTRWYNGWTDVRSIYDAINTGDPYPVVGAVCDAADMMATCNATLAYESLAKLDFFVVLDLFKVPVAGIADILLPAQHWLEVDSPRMSQGASGGLGVAQRVVEPRGETILDCDFVVEGITKAMGQTWGTDDNPYPTYYDRLNWNAQTAGYEGWDDCCEHFQQESWWDLADTHPEDRGTYRRWEMGRMRSSMAKNEYNPVTHGYGFLTPTSKVEILSLAIESCAFTGDKYKYDESIILPTYMEPPLSPVSTPELYEPAGVFEVEGQKAINLTAATGRRIPVYFHNEHRMLPWCRELRPVPLIELNHADAEKIGVEQGDWVWIETKDGKIRQTVDIFDGISEGVCNLEHQWWYPELDQADKGFKLSCCNCLIDPLAQDPISATQMLRGFPVRVYKATPENSPFGNPVPCGNDGTPIICDSSDPRLKAWLPDFENMEA